MNWWVLGPFTFLAGIITIGIGWWWLWNCTGWWPEDRRNIIFGLPLFGIGAFLIVWGVYHTMAATFSLV